MLVQASTAELSALDEILSVETGESRTILDGRDGVEHQKEVAHCEVAVYLTFLESNLHISDPCSCFFSVNIN